MVLPGGENVVRLVMGAGYCRGHGGWERAGAVLGGL